MNRDALTRLRPSQVETCLTPARVEVLHDRLCTRLRCADARLVVDGRGQAEQVPHPSSSSGIG